MRVSIILVDDHPFIREGVRHWLHRQPETRVIGEADDAKTALELVQIQRPDLAIVDIHLPDMDGLSLSRQMLALIPELKIILLSADADAALATEALKMGIAGYVLKGDISGELGRAMDAVMKGKIYLSPEIASLLLHGYKAVLQSPISKPKLPLSEREVDVLKRIAEGHSTKDIAAELNLSTKTIETHRLNIMKALDLHSVAELTKFAIRAGITPL